MLAVAWSVFGEGVYPGRSEALLTLALALALLLPPTEYELPEDALETLIERVRAARGRRLRIRGARGHKGLAEEQPAAYKDVDQVVEVVDKAGISKKVARLRPVGVIKG